MPAAMSPGRANGLNVVVGRGGAFPFLRSGGAVIRAAGFIPSAPGCILHPGYSQRLMIAFGLGAFCTQDSIFVSGCISFLFGCTTWVHFLFCIRSRLLLGALTAAAVTCCEKIMDLNWMGGAHKPEILARRIQMRDPDPHTIHYSH